MGGEGRIRLGDCAGGDVRSRRIPVNAARARCGPDPWVPRSYTERVCCPQLPSRPRANNSENEWNPMPGPRGSRPTSIVNSVTGACGRCTPVF